MRLVHRSALALVFGAAILAAHQAHAQFANRSVGFSLGYEKLNNDPTLEWGLPLGLESSLYIENSFDVTLRGSVMLLTEKVYGRPIWALSTALGVRYLFSEEHLRPYGGLDLRYFHIFRPEGQDASSNYVGVGPHLGLDYFVVDSFTVGVRGTVAIYVTITDRIEVNTSLGAQAVAAWYF